jgi:hypothetical protein
MGRQGKLEWDAIESMDEERCSSWKLLGGGARLKLLKSEEVVKEKEPSLIVFGSGEGRLNWVGDGPAQSISSLDKLSILFLVQLFAGRRRGEGSQEAKEEREGNEGLDFALKMPAGFSDFERNRFLGLRWSPGGARARAEATCKMERLDLSSTWLSTRMQEPRGVRDRKRKMKRFKAT